MVDITAIEAALGLATSTVGFTERAAGAVQRIKDLVSSDKPASPELQAALNDLAMQLTAANLLNFQLSNDLNTVAIDLRREDEFARQKARYELVRTNGGDMIMRLREDSRDNDPQHFVCTVCLQDRRISYLREFETEAMCQKCDHVFRLQPLVTRERRAGPVF